MNKMNKRQSIACLAIALIFLGLTAVLPSCKKSTDVETEITNRILGTWTCSNHWYGGSDTYVFKSSGKYQWTGPSSEEYGDYSFNGVILTTSSSSGVTRVFTIISLTDTYFVMMDQEASSYTYYKGGSSPGNGGGNTPGNGGGDTPGGGGNNGGGNAGNVTPDPPTGAIKGLFSVSATKQVWFSQGNLQYCASSNSWRFANNQYDYVGNGNSYISSSYVGWIDLFGWGTSGWNSGSTCYQPWSNEWLGSNYGPSGMYDLVGSYANADWGVYNAISNGGNTSGRWRTLTMAEWDYVLNARNTELGIRFAKANVQGVNGVLLFPDNWSDGTYSPNSTNSTSAAFSSNTISASQWSSLEASGIVFLPASGLRHVTVDGTVIDNAGEFGAYWTVSNAGSISAYNVFFSELNVGVGSQYSQIRDTGLSVRLVQDYR